MVQLELSAKNLRVAAARFRAMALAGNRRIASIKANFNPNQPRIPRGNTEGGRWTKIPGGDDAAPVIRVGANSRRPSSSGGRPIRRGDRIADATPAQLARLDASRLAMNSALADVRRIDPRWKPGPQAYETIEGEISANENSAREALAWIRELARRNIGPGPYAFEWVEARGDTRIFRKSERIEINRIGRRYGCHSCGTRDPGTASGNFIIDHQLPARWALEPYRLYPHCANCSRSQGGHVTNMLWRREQ